MDTYRTFIRSCNNFEQFARARKITQERGLSLEQARERCRQYNDNLNSRQRAKGTRMEFTREN